MDRTKYVIFSGELSDQQFQPEPRQAYAEIACMGRRAVPGCIYTRAGWLRGPLQAGGLHRHTSGEVLMFLGSDHDHPEQLNAEIELQIEHDVLTFNRTCAVFIPAGAAHGELKVKRLERDVLCCCCHPDTDVYEAQSAQASAPAGTYARNFVDRYDTTGVQLPNVRAEVMTRLYYLDSRRVPGAPYFESVWFNIPTPAFLEPHVHQLNEVIFFAGSNADHPGDLDGKIDFYIDGEPVTLDRSCILFIPAGVPHTPFEILEMNHPCLHFSGGNNSNYHRD